MMFSPEWVASTIGGMLTLLGFILHFERRLTRVETVMETVVKGIAEIKELL